MNLIAYNTSSINSLKLEVIRTIMSKVSSMEQLSASHISQAIELESQASALDVRAIEQSQISTSAVRTVYHRSLSGERYGEELPDELARSIAHNNAVIFRENAKSLRQQATELRVHASELKRAAAVLGEALTTTNRALDRHLSRVKELDQSYARLFSDLNTRTGEYTNRLHHLFDSINELLSLSNENLTNIEYGLSALPADLADSIKSALAGDREYTATGGDPINLSTGNFTYSKDDITIPGRYPLSFVRFYNTIIGSDMRSGALGANWTHCYNIRLLDSTDSVRIVFGDGHVENYRKSPDGYISPPGCHSTLTSCPPGHILTLHSLDVYTFDAEGSLVSITDANGNTTVFTYTNGLLISATTAGGSLTFTYDAPGDLMTGVSDHSGRSVTYTYTDGYLTKSTHPCGSSYGYVYTYDGLLCEVINPLGITVLSNDYDSNSRTTRQRFADGGVYAINYADHKKTATVTTQNYNYINYIRDVRYRTIAISQWTRSEHFGYDDDNNRTLHTDYNGNTHLYEYDSRGNVTASTDPLGGILRIEYSDHNRPLMITLPCGGVTRLSYDTRGNMTEVCDPLGRTVRLSHDTHGLPVSVTMPDDSVSAISYD
ncbi:MAG: DUF6531 domain-containing protein, partial [Lachnospiraceae bacterium]|nr:DUF6531 domain-containing protein [Lachnospiraceae bacterium]